LGRDVILVARVIPDGPKDQTSGCCFTQGKFGILRCAIAHRGPLRAPE